MSSSEAAQRAAMVERPGLLDCFASLTDLPFECSLKAVGDALHAITTNIPLTATSSSTAVDLSSLILVPTKLQVFKEKPHQATGKKFGFVHFKVMQKPSETTAAAAAAAAASAAPFSPSLLAEAVDRVLTSPEAALLPQAVAGCSFRLRRVPDNIIEHFQCSPLVQKAKDPLKVLCLVAARATEHITVSSKWTIPKAMPIHDMAVLRVEVPDLFPTVANSASLEKFLLEHLPSCDFFVRSE